MTGSPLRLPTGSSSRRAWPAFVRRGVLVRALIQTRADTRKEAEAYLQWLYSDEGQEIAAKHHLRPRNAKVLAAHAREFPKVDTFTVDELFGGWKAAQKTHFDDGGTYDQILAATKRQ